VYIVSYLQDECSDNELGFELPRDLVDSQPSSSSTMDRVINSACSQQPPARPLNNDISPSYSRYNSHDDIPMLGVKSSCSTVVACSSKPNECSSFDWQHPNNVDLLTSSALGGEININQIEATVIQETEMSLLDESSSQSSFLSAMIAPSPRKSPAKRFPSYKHCGFSEAKKLKSNPLTERQVDTLLMVKSREQRKTSQYQSYTHDSSDKEDYDNDCDPLQIIDVGRCLQAKKHKGQTSKTPAVKFAIADWTGNYQ